MPAVQSQGQQNVLLDGEGVQQIVLLEDEPQVLFTEFRQFVFGQFRDVDVFIIAVTLSMVESMFKSVVLPEPEDPMTPTNSPCSTWKLTRSTALAALEPFP